MNIYVTEAELKLMYPDVEIEESMSGRTVATVPTPITQDIMDSVSVSSIDENGNWVHDESLTQKACSEVMLCVAAKEILGVNDDTGRLDVGRWRLS